MYTRTGIYLLPSAYTTTYWKHMRREPGYILMIPGSGNSRGIPSSNWAGLKKLCQPMKRQYRCDLEKDIWGEKGHALKALGRKDEEITLKSS